MNGLFSGGPWRAPSPFCFHYLCNPLALCSRVFPGACHTHAGTAFR